MRLDRSRGSRAPRRSPAVAARAALCVIGVAFSVGVSPCSAEWKPAEGPLFTRWAKDVDPSNPLPEYPRPHLRREAWQSLNGLWSYAITAKDSPRPQAWDGEILVPFAIESALSGVGKTVGPEKALWYRRTFRVDADTAAKRILLHFGAVDWDATVWVDGAEVGSHRGGYDPFSFDISTSLAQERLEHEIVVRVEDGTDSSYQPRGKQVRDPRGIWYTSVTGIWQTVWLEPVPFAHVASLRVTPDFFERSVAVEIDAVAPPGETSFEVTALADGEAVGRATVSVTGAGGRAAARVLLPIPNARPWTPDTPFLYDLDVSLVRGGVEADSVRGYFGLRSVTVDTDADGYRRLFLNGEALFQLGPLDQGWWPDGLYTAPTDEALRYDVEITRKLGFNMARKHVKVEPERWYWHCDRLGLLVWQDMPNGDRHIGPNDPDMTRSAESEANYRREWAAILAARHNHPSIVVWVPFNEGWGQFKTDEILAWTKSLDPSRLVDGPSGWADRGTGDLNDMHSYPGPNMPKPESVRAVVLGEFGGLGLPLEGHLWWNKRNWGYRTYSTYEELRTNYDALYVKLRRLHGRGLAAAVYTQTTDVEGEVNGLMTYDRAVVKLDVDHVAAIHRAFYVPPPIISVRELVPSSRDEAQVWRYTTKEPADGWSGADFDDSSWKQGPGGFGEASTPGAVVRTPWKTSDIWIRREFELEDTRLAAPTLWIHHDEDTEVYINGRLAAKLSGWTTGYVEVPLTPEGRRALREGRNVFAAHTKQTSGGQYIDVGLVDVSEKPRPRSE